MKKLDKVLSVVMVVLMLVCACSNVFAGQISIGDINDNADLNQDAKDKMTNIGSVVLTTVTNVGIILSVTVIAILGVKYMLGSVEEKAEYKKAMMPYVVGAILVFGASAVARFATGLGSSLGD